MLKNYDPLKVNVAYNGRQLRMFGDSLFTGLVWFGFCNCLHLASFFIH